MAEPPRREIRSETESAKTEIATLSHASSGAASSAGLPEAASPEASGAFSVASGAPRAVLSTPPQGPPLVGGRYEILGMLGSGGMGTVYHARDRELDEMVALKVLKKELAAAPGMIERFRREVKLARRVTHKNVARTFDIGEDGGDRFLTMELIEGEMLGALLERRGRVPLAEVIGIARDVCAGLAAAHAAGVLHRDLKPENVIVARDGRSVITDFGIARALAHADLARTQPGLVGTPAYMAPEQVEGAEDLDGRADLYALGAMLFELLSGELPWTGASIIAVAAARLLKPPPDVRTHAPEVPPAAAELILKLMARERDARYPTAEAASEALGALATSLAAAPLPNTTTVLPRPVAASPALESPGAPRAHRQTLAVLPFANLGSADDAYLAQTLTEEIVDLLSVVPALRVRPRGDSARAGAAASRDVRQIGRELGVDVVASGSVRRIDDLVRVSVRLVTVEDGFQLWAHRFDRPAGRVQTVADDAAAAIARALATELTAEARPLPADPVAQELFWRGRYLLHSGWFEVSREAIATLKAAHERAPDDPRIAGTYALAIARFLAAETNATEAAATGLAIAEKTLAMDPAQAEARVAIGYLHLSSSEGVAATAALKGALAIAPNNVEALDAIGRIALEIGRVESGIRTMERALAIEPAMGTLRHSIAKAQALCGDENALETMGPLPADPGGMAGHLLLAGRIVLWRGDRARAADLLRVVENGPLSPFAKRSIGDLLHVAVHGALPAGHRLDANVPLDPGFPPRRLSYHAQLRAEVKIRMGLVEEAMVELRAADSNGLFDLLWLDRCLVFEGLRERADYRAVRETVSARARRILDVLEPGARLTSPVG